MRSTFYGLEIARSGMNAQQIGLDVTSHNIANANTPGFTRQQPIMRTIAPVSASLSKFVSNNTGQMAGMGAAIQQIRQIRDSFLDSQYRKENKRLGEWQIKQQSLSLVEAIFNEPSETGINSVLNEFFNALQAMSLNPEDPTTRATVQQKAFALTEYIREVYIKLEELQRQLDDNIISYVQEINSYAKEISELNKLIFKYEASGQRANDLRDQRELLLDKLSEIVDVTSYEDADGRFRVDIGGQMLVNHFDVKTLDVKVRSGSLTGNPPKNNYTDIDGLHEVVWSETGDALNINGGILKGLMDMRDGIGAKEDPITDAEGNIIQPPNKNTTFGIPYYMQQWNAFAKNFMIKFNAIHREGYNLYGETGIDFFSDGSDQFDPQNVNHPAAKFITLSKELQDDWNNIAAIYLDEDDGGIGPGDAEGNNKNLLRLIALRHDTDFMGGNSGTMDNYIKSLISTLGVSSRQAQHMMENQQFLTAEISRRRMSVSGVSLDEEMANMVKFQHAYNASARVFTAMDQILDTLINRLGLAGR